MWFDPIIKTILRSPLHRMVSGNMMLMTYTGRKSGRQYQVPMDYFVIKSTGAKYLATLSRPERTWWRNLRGREEVNVLVEGTTHLADANVFESRAQVEDLLYELFAQYPDMGGRFNVEVVRGGPERSDIARLAGETVFIRTELKHIS
jgi:hypothetical protein